MTADEDLQTIIDVQKVYTINLFHYHILYFYIVFKKTKDIT